MMRKNISNLTRHDLLLKYQYETKDGKSVYGIYLAADYIQTSLPKGTVALGPKIGDVDLQWAASFTGRLMSTAVEEGDEG